ncbi:MAG: prepilin-type N-terminal cleavage/methylation domain-containing protein [Planctomycetota bacterium]
MDAATPARRFPRTFRSASTRAAAAFTLVEILIVVVILGILAAIVLPAIADVTTGGKQTAFVTDITQYHKAAQVFMAERGEYLEDASSGTLPTGFDAYVKESDWIGGTPLGGVWDVEFESSGITSALGVHFNGDGDTQDDAFMTVIDQMLDDGDLTTGGFRKLTDGRYYLILER